MATPERIESSQRLARAATAELARLRKALTRAERKEITLRRQLSQVESEATELRQRIALLERIASDEGELVQAPGERKPNVVELRSASIEPPNGFLRGATIRIVAARLLAETESAPRAVHYLEWLQLLQRAGYGIEGQDPPATFLTQLNRSPVVVRGGEPGTYLLDHEAPTQLRARLEQLSNELLALHQGQQTIEAITSTRERRAELVTAIGRTERSLEEAIDSLGVEPSDDPQGEAE